jgi:hypothetical protein
MFSPKEIFLLFFFRLADVFPNESILLFFFRFAKRSLWGKHQRA